MNCKSCKLRFHHTHSYTHTHTNSFKCTQEICVTQETYIVWWTRGTQSRLYILAVTLVTRAFRYTHTHELMQVHTRNIHCDGREERKEDCTSWQLSAFSNSAGPFQRIFSTICCRNTARRSRYMCDIRRLYMRDLTYEVFTCGT